MGRRSGAPLILNEKLQNDLCNLLRIGISIEDACDQVGIHHATYYNWNRQALAAQKKRKLNDEQTRYLNFFEAVKKARAESKIRCVISIDKAANKLDDWRAAAWLLERRFPEEYGRRDQVKVHEAQQGEDFRPKGEYEKMLLALYEIEKKSKEDDDLE
jgi:transposase